VEFENIVLAPSRSVEGDLFHRLLPHLRNLLVGLTGGDERTCGQRNLVVVAVADVGAFFR